MTEQLSRAFILERIEDFTGIEEYARKRRLAWEARLVDASTEPAAASPTPAREPTAAPLMGRPMTSKFAGRCRVCNGPIPPGTAIIYRGSDKASAHAACGTDDGGARR